MSAIERFWLKVAVVFDDSSCWEWTGSRSAAGYGQFRPGGTDRQVVATRWVLAQEIGRPLAADEQAGHVCDNPPCVRPSHLFLTDRLGNMRDAVLKNRMASGDRNGRRLHPYRGLPRPALAPAVVSDIRTRLAAGESHASIARLHEISNAAVSRIANGSRHKETAA